MKQMAPSERAALDYLPLLLQSMRFYVPSACRLVNGVYFSARLPNVSRMLYRINLLSPCKSSPLITSWEKKGQTQRLVPGYTSHDTKHFIPNWG